MELLVVVNLYCDVRLEGQAIVAEHLWPGNPWMID